VNSVAKVLLVEDDAGDELIAREAFEADSMATVLHVARDGVQALDFLYRRGDHAEAPRPDFVLLDLNLPKVNGHTVLQQVKADPAVSTIPMIVFSTSSAFDDIIACYQAQGNAYITKPNNYDDFVHVVKQINRFWRKTASLPPDPVSA
jgi:two-component system response regulator